MDRIAQIAKQTLRFQKEQQKPTPTHVGQLLESALVLFRGKLAMSKIQIDFQKSDSPVLICYPGEIRQVVANLIQNAIDAMPHGGRLRLRVRPATDWRDGSEGVRITLADTGAGMSTETRLHIYDPFFTTKGNLGTGLGLWITASILSKHRASLHVRSSVAPGHSGTAFTMIFPSAGATNEPPGFGPRD